MWEWIIIDEEASVLRDNVEILPSIIKIVDWSSLFIEKSIASGHAYKFEKHFLCTQTLNSKFKYFLMNKKRMIHTSYDNYCESILKCPHNCL